VGVVLDAVDEFVPQFYDVETRGYSRSAAIAARIDAAKWGPVFNRFHRRFRIGISTFGRSRLVSSRRGPVVFVDGMLLDFALQPGFQLHTSRTEAGELVLRYRAAHPLRLGYTEFVPGDEVEFTLATPESIQQAVEQVRLMSGYCAGVVFFRWPAMDETLATPPDEVLAAAGAPGPKAARAVALHVADGGCAAVYCADLYLLNTSALSPQARQYEVISSSDFEYFLPNERLPVRMAGAARIGLKLPPHGGESALFLGRAVVAKRAEFRLEEKR